MSVTVEGTVEAGWEPVREAFEAFVAAEPHSPEAQLAVRHHGRTVVDLWGGEETDGDTLSGVFSITKGAAHLVVALLVQEGVLDLDRPVSEYWPEFTGHGKEKLTVRQLVAHGSGLIAVDAFSYELIADDALVAAALAGQEPHWEPGTAYGYHAFVIGALTGEVVRRVTGRSVQEVYEERVRAPYGLDLYMGLPQELEPRWKPVLEMLPTPAQLEALAAAGPMPELMRIAFNMHQDPPMDMVAYANHPKVKALGPASAGGVGTARGVAALYAAAISGLEDRPALLKPETVAEVARLHTPGQDAVVPQADHFGLGFETQPLVGPEAFGHCGAAGANGFADPVTGIAYGYTRRRFGFPGGLAPENGPLTAAVLQVARGL
ncbi:CubicO group peptidase (beta-lactamase class C family) [Streptomyces sp. 3211.6]|uniref:serine hydrolase domain-containing protein n=1 Tax=Streptomyces TaxID=1883 RepID=UPI000D1998A8|nr:MULTISPECIES: serine hydrolase domain-containing protein [Streptomyces]RKT06633.1 CubicO group peptidase (beta-lactamase class C family) [Streptomyces sp. 3211.6]RPF45829.1 CubicO group peptidase (beta-lactamase class C family) [Streptomyces sp. Ag109_G2-6]